MTCRILRALASVEYIDVNASRKAASVIRRAGARAQALDALRVIVGALSRSARAVETRTGITNAQVFLLQQLRDGVLSVGELAELAHTHQSTVSIVVARLSRAGLVAKARATDDARRAVVSLTPAGRALLRRAPAPPAADLLLAVEQLPLGDARRLADGLHSLVRSLGLEGQPPTKLFEHPRVPKGRRPAGR
jgi:DNA-binding MarR family transcriptional regulator